MSESIQVFYIKMLAAHMDDQFTLACIEHAYHENCTCSQCVTHLLVSAPAPLNRLERTPKLHNNRANIAE